jgi:phosphatidylserine/phosphatidylglycerophosphate/cardiolipin synthase-like enzyme
MHHKVFIIDGKTVITGSMNPTAGGNERNDENVLIIEDEGIAGLYLEEFEKVWGEATN